MCRDRPREAGSSLGLRALALLLAVELAGCQTVPEGQTVPEVKAPLLEVGECLGLSGDCFYVDCQIASCESLAYTADYLRRLKPGTAINWGRLTDQTIAFGMYFPLMIPASIYDLAKEGEEERVDAERLPADRAQLADIEKLMREKRCPATLPAPAEESSRLIADVPTVDCRAASCDKLAYTRRALQTKIGGNSGADLLGHRARLTAVEEVMQKKGCSLKSPDAKEQPAGSNSGRSVPD
jgi:hypothetical protein